MTNLQNSNSMLNSGTIIQNESKKEDLFEEEENPIINKLEEEVKENPLPA